MLAKSRMSTVEYRALSVCEGQALYLYSIFCQEKYAGYNESRFFDQQREDGLSSIVANRLIVERGERNNGGSKQKEQGM